MARNLHVKHPTSITTLLQTKLHQPHVTRQLVTRPQLWERLDRGLEGQLIVVTASAGYGKTTLITSWLENRAAKSGTAMPTAWLSLDEYDSDLGVFLHYCAAALDTIFPEACPETLALLQAPQPSPLAALVSTLSNEIATLPDDFILVLDDYHTIRGETIPELLVALTRHWPRRLHLILLTRHNPALPLSRLRANGQLTEIRAQDLRFSSEEIQQYFRHTLKRPLSPIMLAQLERQTEGWIAGLHLAAVALQQGLDAATLTSAGEAGSSLTEYLLDEVLDQQPPDIQRFLLETAVFERWCVPLCEEFVECRSTDRGVRASLEWLEQTNFFTIALDDRGEWFRYHHLLRDVLRRRALKALGVDSIADLHRRAAAWFARQGLMVEALHHSLEAHDFDQAARLMRDGLCEVLNREDRATLERWLNLLPVEFIDQHAWLLMMKAWVMHFQARSKAVLETLQQMEDLLAADEPLHRSDDVQLLHGLAETMRGQETYLRNELTRSAAHSQTALTLLPESWTFPHYGSLVYWGLARQALGEEASVDNFLWMEYATRREKTTGSMRLLLPLCINAIQRGHLEQARQTGVLLLELAQRGGLRLMLGWAHYWLGVVAYLWSDLDDAARHFRAVTDEHFTIQARIVRNGLAGLALTQLAQGDLVNVGETVNVLSQYDVSLLGDETDQTRSLRALVHLQQGDRLGAFRWADAFTAPFVDQPLLWQQYAHLTKARILLERGGAADVQSAAQLIDVFAEIAGRTHNTRYEVITSVMRAQVLEAQGETTTALAALHHAIDLARPGDMIRPFVDHGSRVQLMLSQLIEQPPADDFRRRLLAAFPAAESRLADSRQPQITPPLIEPLIEPLTARELDVLALMRERLSDKEIAQRLGIAPVTVKRHSANLFGKLGVNRRWDAVAKAENLGLLSAR